MKTALILYVEDDENDVFLMQHAFKKAGIENPLAIVPDGQAAIDYLEGKNGFEDRQHFPLPSLILLDLKLPHKSGLDVLKWIRSTPVFCAIPVIMLTSSNQDSHIHRAYILGANSYLVKPGQPTEMLAMVSTIRDYWLNFNRASRLECGAPR